MSENNSLSEEMQQDALLSNAETENNDSQDNLAEEFFKATETPYHERYYLKYREAGKVCDKYIGKDPQKVSELKEQLEQRKHYEKMLASLRQEQRRAVQRLSA